MSEWNELEFVSLQAALSAGLGDTCVYYREVKGETADHLILGQRVIVAPDRPSKGEWLACTEMDLHTAVLLQQKRKK